MNQEQRRSLLEFIRGCSLEVLGILGVISASNSDSPTVVTWLWFGIAIWGIVKAAKSSTKFVGKEKPVDGR